LYVGLDPSDFGTLPLSASGLNFVELDEDVVNDVPTVVFGSIAGEIVTGPGHAPQSGTLDVTMSGVILLEYALGAYVPGGRCYSLTATLTSCGDGICAANEDSSSCPTDCSAAWTCDPAWQGDGECDCGCGAFDAADCVDASDASCGFCGPCSPTSDCASVVDDTQNWLCEGATWTCNPAWQGDGECDCGCGAFDSADCANATDAVCLYCDACNPTSDCASVVNDTQNWLCEGTTWTCDPAWQGDGECDCGCGIFDSADCVDTTEASCLYCDACNPDPDCASVVHDTQNWLCE
jgi:hypothetical protein